MRNRTHLLAAGLLALAGLLAAGTYVSGHGSGGNGGGFPPPPPPGPPSNGGNTGGGAGGGGPAVSPGAGGPTSPGATSPGSNPGPAGSRPGRATSPGGAAPRGAGPSSPRRGAGASSPASPSDVVADLASWRYWWRYNRHPYLDHRARLSAQDVITGSDEFYLGRGEAEDSRETGLRPGALRVRAEVTPVLRELLATETSSHVLTSAMLSIAKFGEAPDATGAPTIAAFVPFLADGNVTIAEVAALSIGILGEDAGARLLAHLLADDDEGQRLCGGGVPERMRAFAAFGLGLIGRQTERVDVRRFVVHTLTHAFDGDGGASHDVEVACLLSIGLVPLPPASDATQAANAGASRPVPSRGLADQVAWCVELLDDSDRGWLVEAHVPTTLARLVQTVPADADVRIAAVERLIDVLGPRSRAARELRQSAAQALGWLGDADGDPEDEKIRRTLEGLLEHEADRQTRAFALISLARIAGRPGAGDEPQAGTGAVRSRLLKKLSRGKSFERPWAAIALGVMERALLDAGQDASVDVQKALRETLATERSPELVGAVCIAIGMVRDASASAVLMEFLDRTNPETRVYAVLALGMIGASGSGERLDELLEESLYQPRLVWSTAVAMALMRDEGVVLRLLDMLEKSSSLVTRAGVCFALGHVGDASAVTALIGLTQAGKSPDVARGIAVEALGILGDEEVLPWNACLSIGTNYRANSSTLSDPGTTGILDMM